MPDGYSVIHGDGKCHTRNAIADLRVGQLSDTPRNGRSDATLTGGPRIKAGGASPDSEDIICFTAGTLIKTPRGERRIETLCPGDTVLTLDNGPQPLRWIGKETVRASGNLAPIRFAKTAFGGHRDLLVSPQHRMLFRGPTAEMLFGRREVLAPAKSLVDEYSVTTEFGGMVTYVHLLFDRHQIVFANGIPSESFYPGTSELESLPDASRQEVFRLFPELRSNFGGYGPASRTCLSGQAARALATA